MNGHRVEELHREQVDECVDKWMHWWAAAYVLGGWMHASRVADR